MAKTKERDTATLLFAILKDAKERNDFAGAAEAERQLKEMGVAVRFTDRPAGKKRGGTPCN